MKILAFESSCDETAAAVVENGRKILSNIVLSQIETHKKYGGVVPEIASRAHTEAICSVCRQALEQANLILKDIDAIAVTNRPGLIGALLVGVNFAKALAYSENLPIIPVNHIHGHIAASYLEYEDLKPPFLSLVMSGGHTSIIGVESYTEFKLIGSTRDDAAGEAFDKVARVLGIPYPGGKYIDELSYNGRDDFSFPNPIIKDDKFDFSFSGLKTAVINKVHNDTQSGVEIRPENVAAAFTKAVCAGIKNRLENILNCYEYKTLSLAGGVAANSHIRFTVKELCEKRGIKLYLPPLYLCGDNAAMIGAQAFYDFNEGKLAGIELNAYASSDI